MRARPISFSFPHRLGFGCSGPWAEPWFSEKKARAVLFAALEGGVRHVDTAGFYAKGEAERRLGRALKEFGEPLFVSTKIGKRYQGGRAPVQDFSPAAVRSDVEASLARLCLERIDLLYLHGPGDWEITGAAETLARLREEGKIDLVGVCSEGIWLDRAIDLDLDVVMAPYNLFDRRHAAAFQKAKAKGMGVVAIAPLAQGLFRRDFLFPKTPADLWHVARAVGKNPRKLREARAARRLLNSVEGWTPAQLALAFVHANPAVDVAVTTTTKAAHFMESLAAAGRPLAGENRRLLEALAPVTP
ncbi:MAG: aldo/keto reductase [Parvularculaceae bacterium]